MAAGWAAYDARLDNPGWVPWAVREQIMRHRDRMLKPGDPVEGRRIVVFTEQGLKTLAEVADAGLAKFRKAAERS